MFQGHSVPETACPATHSRGQTPPPAGCGAVRPDAPRHRWGPSPPACAGSAGTAWLGPSAPTTARRLPPRPSAASRRCVSGGARAASGTGAWSRGGLRRTAGLRAGTGRARWQPHARRRGTSPRSRPDSLASARRPTTSAPPKRWARTHRRRAIARRQDKGRPRSRSPRTRGSIEGGVSGTPAPSASSVARASSATPCGRNSSRSTSPAMACGRSIARMCPWRAWTNVMSSGEADCHPCSRSKMPPMFPVATGWQGCGAHPPAPASGVRHGRETHGDGGPSLARRSFSLAPPRRASHSRCLADVGAVNQVLGVTMRGAGCRKREGPSRT